MLNVNKIKYGLLYTYLIAYLFLPMFVKDLSMLGVLKIFLATLLCVLLYKKNSGSSNSKSIFRMILPLFVFFVTAQFLCFHSMLAVKFAVNVIFFLFFALYSDSLLAQKFAAGVKVMALSIVIIALYYCLVNGQLYFFRSEILIEKQTMSIVLCLASTFCLVEGSFAGLRLKNMILLVLFLLANLFIIQSKTALFVLAIDVVALCLIHKQFYVWLKGKVVYFAAVFVLFLSLLPSIVLPDDIRFGVNRLTGCEIFSTQYDRSVERMDMTYSIRDDVRKYCFSLFLQNPLMGIGLGNFERYNKYSNTSVKQLIQPESQWLGILCEGGVVYVGIFFVFFMVNMKNSYNVLKKDVTNVFALNSFMLQLNYSIMFIFNDFLDSLFWFSTGIFLGAMKNRKK